MDIAMIGPFGIHTLDLYDNPKAEFLGYKGTVMHRMIPMAHVLKGRGHNVSVILPPFQPDSIRKNIQIGGVFVENIHMGKGLTLRDHIGIAFKLAIRALEHHGSNGIIHIFKPKGYSGLAGIYFVLAKRFGIGKIKLVVDVDDWEGYGGWNDIMNYSRIEKDFFHFQESFLTQKTQALTVASHYLLKRFRTDGIKNIKYIPNGPSPLRFMPEQRFRKSRDLMRRLRIPQDAIVLLIYSQFRDFNYKAFASVVGDIMNRYKNTYLLVVGSGRNNEELRFRRAIENKGVDRKRVILAGFVSLVKVMKYIALGDIALFPYDNNNITRSKCSVRLIDLMVASKAIVASNIGENKYYLASNAGVLVNDYSDFTGAVDELINDDKKRMVLGERARTRIWKNYNWERTVKEIEQLYSRLSD